MNWSGNWCLRKQKPENSDDRDVGDTEADEPFSDGKEIENTEITEPCDAIVKISILGSCSPERKKKSAN